MRNDETVRCYVALGDSYTAGVPGVGYPPWPERLAALLGDGVRSPRMLNLGEWGAWSLDVASRQIGRALVCTADLVTVVVGANDVVLDVRPDLERVRRSLFVTLRALRWRLPSATIAAATYPDFSPHIPFRPHSKRRVQVGLAAVNDAVRHACDENDVVCVDLAGALQAAELFAPDGIHVNDAGHDAIARAFARELHDRCGVRVSDDEAVPA
jgi:lysophospholipase L1-like esterase